MPDVICNTSPLQYLHQADVLELLPALVGQVCVPEAVVAELREGRRRNVRLPALEELSWLIVRPVRDPTLLPLVTHLGDGEKEVLALGLETQDWSWRSPAPSASCYGPRSEAFSTPCLPDQGPIAIGAATVSFDQQTCLLQAGQPTTRLLMPPTDRAGIRPKIPFDLTVRFRTGLCQVCPLFQNTS